MNGRRKRKGRREVRKKERKGKMKQEKNTGK